MAYGRHAIEKRGRNTGVLVYITYNFQDTKMGIPGAVTWVISAGCAGGVSSKKRECEGIGMRVARLEAGAN